MQTKKHLLVKEKKNGERAISKFIITQPYTQKIPKTYTHTHTEEKNNC